MSARDALPDALWTVRPAVAAAAVPLVVGLAALADGYLVPADAAELVFVATSGVALGLVGLVGWWCHDRGRRAAVGVAIAAVVGAVGLGLLRPGVTATRVAGDAVAVGDPLLARFVGVGPWLVVVVGVVGAVESEIPGLRATTGRDATPIGRLPRRGALRLAAASGVALAVLSALPVYLLGRSFGDPALLGFAVGGWFVGGLAVAYLFARHRVVTPLVCLVVVVTAAVVAVATGGSPLGLPTAWVVWLVPGLVAGTVEALGRRVFAAFR
ncbi:hypothetical protein [Halorussus salinus]|uniref:hypothetical protein n=1 Tax=Halorussus salinus TaxID=1364935 RepID=UPI001092F419|nr:hypothetical protein [Halorussus salinus]